MTAAALGEAGHMGLVLLLSRPWDDALALVQIIALPMIVLNAAGAGVLTHLIGQLAALCARRDAHHAQTILSLANRTVNHLRQGLNPQSAQATAQILCHELGVAAVAITNTTHVLAHVGLGQDHHLAHAPIRTQSTRDLLHHGTAVFLHTKHDIGCDHPECPLTSAILVPLTKGEHIVGALKIYGSQRHPLDEVFFQLAQGIGQLFATQLELEDIHRQKDLLAQAEIRRLQAQMNPHFLFNALSAIASFCRTDPGQARQLLLDLSHYLRGSIDTSSPLIPLANELQRVEAYLAIERARFGDRIAIQLHIDPSCRTWPVPPLILQPLVENAIQHGLRHRESGGTVCVTAVPEGQVLCIRVEDNGSGIPAHVLYAWESHTLPIDRLGLTSCDERLRLMYGPNFGLHIKSKEGQGTAITLYIPRKEDCL